MKENKTAYPNKMTDDQSNAKLSEAANFFSRLSPEAQNTIINLVKCLINQKPTNM